MKTRPILFGLVALFALYAVIVAPEQSAAFVKDVFALLAAGVNSVFAFFNALIS